MRGSHLLFVMIFIAMFAAKNDAQTLTVERHLPYTTDSLLVYKLPYIEVSDSGKHCVWDFSNLSTDSAEMIGVDYYAHSANDTAYIGCHREHANYFYHHWLDTLWQTGYETSHTYVRYSVPIPLLRFPFTYGDSICAQFTGTGQYCHIMSFHIDGVIISDANAIGQLVLPDVTIDSVLRIHSYKSYFERRHTPNRIEEERYLWYSPYCRYPLLESVRVQTVVNADTNLYLASYYFPQEQVNMPDPIQVRSDDNPKDVDSLVTEVKYLPNPVYTNLEISYSLVRSAQVYISLHYNGGVTTCQTPVQYEEEGRHSVSINMSGLPTGGYAVYIHADETVVAGNIIKY